MASDVQSLLTARQIAEMLGVAPRTVNGWVERYPSFPVPAGEMAGARVWRRSEVLEWHRGADLRPGAPVGNRNAVRGRR